MASSETTITVDFRPSLKECVMETLVSDIGSMWDDYCYENNVPPEIKLHGIQFLEHWAKIISEGIKEK